MYVQSSSILVYNIIKMKRGTSMLKNIVFDMGNVIIEWNPKRLSKTISSEHAEILETYLFGSKTWPKLDEGLVSLEEGLNEVLENTPKEFHDLMTYAYYHWGDHIDLLENTHELMIKLKEKGYHLYLLSNAGVLFDEYHKKYPVFELLEEKYVSAHHKMVKPDPKIFLDFLDCYGLKAEECLFIDDVLDNVLGARSVGMQAYQFFGDTSELEEMLL